MFSAAIYTLGCKVNQLESEALAGAFRQAGFDLVSRAEDTAEPGILIINTCTVTSKADQKARRIIRKALRDNPRCCVIVTGCYAQLESRAIEALDSGGRLFVLKGEDKSALLDLPGFIAGAGAGGDAGECRRPFTGVDSGDLPALVRAWTTSRQAGRDPFRFAPEDFSFHTRGFLKIQDGCDKQCTYCRVRLARGKSVSLGAEQALAHLRELEARGYAEAMLTGVNISRYRDAGRGLDGLLERLLAGTSRIALRLSSLDPDGVDEQFAGVLAHRRIRPHFHLSVQSGSEDILARMDRGYGPDAVERAAALFRSVKDDPFLACDIITGFPGETESEFQKTFSLCKNTGFAWIHAFPYSRRPGTAACAFKGQVSERYVARRTEALLKLAREGRRDYARRWAGREAAILIESGGPDKAGYCRGTSENYLKLLVKYAGPLPPEPGTVLRCVIGEGGIPDGLDFDAEAIEISANKVGPGALA